MKLKAVFFDLDGTLLDTAPDLVKALNRTLNANNKASLPFDVARDAVSDGANAMLEMGFDIPRNSQDILPLRQQMLDFYLEDLSGDTHPFSGITTLIQKLANQNIIWGIATNKPWTYTEPLMKRFTFASDPICTLCPDHVENRKPAPDSLYLACEYARCSIDEAIYIGDHHRDILCGQNAGMKTIAATYGYIDKGDDPKNWNADYSVNSAEEIWPILQPLLSTQQ